MFYTNVQPHGNFIALRGVNDRGESFKKKVNYEPTLFVESHKPQNPQWKTLRGKNVAGVKWGSMKETKEAIRQYGGDVYGLDQFQYSYISDNYPGMVDYDLSKIKIAFIDIECSSEFGFPNIREANEEVLAISIKMGSDFKTYACGEYNPPSHVRYIKCINEEHLLTEFINDWASGCIYNIGCGFH